MTAGTRCQVVDKTYDAKSTVIDQLDVIRGRRSQPITRIDLDVTDPAAVHAYAVAFVERQQAQGLAVGIDPDLYTATVERHLTPCPNRLWLHRRDARRLKPCPQLADPSEPKNGPATLAAWTTLHSAGLAGHGEEGDIVSEVLAPDLERLPATPGPERVVIVTTSTDARGATQQRVTQAELWLEADWPEGAA